MSGHGWLSCSTTARATRGRAVVGGCRDSDPLPPRRSWSLYGPGFFGGGRPEAAIGRQTLVADGRLVPEGRVAPARVVPALAVVEQRAACLGGCADPLAVEQLTFKCGEEAFATSVVVGVPDRAHRWSDAEGHAPLPVGDGGVLAPVIGVMDDTVGPALRQGHV